MAEAFFLILAPAFVVAVLVWRCWGAIVRSSSTVPAALGGFAILLMLAPGPAAAADAYVVPVPPELVAELVNYVLLVLATLALWVFRRLTAWLRIDAESKLASRLEDGMVAALGYARQQALIQTRPLDAVEVRSRMVADAAAYLLPKMPQTLKALGIDAAGLSERLEARLPLIRDLVPAAPVVEARLPLVDGMAPSPAPVDKNR